ncbi:hypothetical protein MKI77_000436 [Escherichia coli]|nr:hypothetical protein [Escherichia coli]
MTNEDLPENNEKVIASEIIRQKQEETRARLEAELAEKRKQKPAQRLARPGKFELEEFLSKYPRRLKATKNRPPG